MKAATAVVSIVTAVLLVRLMPPALALPSPSQLRAANAELEAANARLVEEIRERRLVEAQLERAHAETEALVQRRTAALAEADTRLQASEARCKALVSASADLVWTARPDGIVDDIAAWAPFTGALGDGETARDLIHPEEQAWVLDDWRKAVQTETPYDCRHRMRRPDGGWRHVHVRAVPVRDDDGTVREWIGVHEDISDRIETERQIATMQEQLRQAQRLEAVGGREGVLLVDDSDDVRLFVTRILEQAGCKVTAASSGAAALELLRADARVVDLLLTDVVMPGMNGRELARAVAELRPHAAVLYMSGFTDNAIVANGMLDPGTNFLAKPFSPEQQLAEIRRVLGARASRQQAG